MGLTCCSTGSANSSQQSINTKRPERSLPLKTNHKINSDSHSDSNLDSTTGVLNTDEYYIESTPEIPHTSSEKEKAISGFKSAIHRGNDSLAMYFVQEYPELDLLQVKFENGDNALQVAVKGKSNNLILYLLENGVSPNEQNQINGETALHCAVRARDVKIVAFLSKYLADANIENQSYETPLSIAADNKDEDIIELLAPDTIRELRRRLTGDSYLPPGPPRTFAPCISSNGLHEMAESILRKDTIDSYLPGPPRTLAPCISSNGLHEIADAILRKDTIDVPPEETIKQQISTDWEKEWSDKLDSSDKFKLETFKIARQSPFSKLKRHNTKKALLDMENIVNSTEELPTLGAWLEKKRSSVPRVWQKRWVVVQGSHMLWSNIQRNIKDPKDAKERKKFNNSINIMSITEIKRVKKGTQRQFTLKVGNNKNRKEYLWRCATEPDRDYWNNGLKQHIAHLKCMINYLGPGHL